ncbi:MAG: acyl-CoA thioesterase [Akkermansiaceae bacterium]|nr:acyl-CoA thioesterase [Akkermansiaceae bacterium]
MPAYTHHSRVAFADTDASGIVYFSNFFRYAQEAEVYALAAHGFTRMDMRYPRVHAEADFIAPLQFWDPIRTEAALLQIGRTSLHWQFTIYGPQGVAAIVKTVVSRRMQDFSPAPYSDAERQRLQALLLTAENEEK